MERFLKNKGYIGESSEMGSLKPDERCFLSAMREPSLVSPTRLKTKTDLSCEFGGFSLHAGRTVYQGDKKGRERLCRYTARPPFAEAQLQETDSGDILFELKKQRRKKRVITLTALAFLRRLS